MEVYAIIFHMYIPSRYGKSVCRKEKLGSWTAQKIPNLSNILMECMYLKCAQPYCLLKTELINFQHSCMEPWDEMN